MSLLLVGPDLAHACFFSLVLMASPYSLPPSRQPPLYLPQSVHHFLLQAFAVLADASFWNALFIVL